MLVPFWGPGTIPYDCGCGTFQADTVSGGYHVSQYSIYLHQGSGMVFQIASKFLFASATAHTMYLVVHQSGGAGTRQE